MKMLLTTISIVVFMATANAYAASEGLIIVELTTQSKASASEEFVELLNPTDVWIDLSDWKLEYMPAGASGWTIKATLSGKVGPEDRYLTSTEDSLKSGLASLGGHIRIVDEDGVEKDRIGWGSAIDALGQPSLAHDKGQSIKRRVDEDGLFVNTGVNADDFFVSDNPSPQPSRLSEVVCELPPVSNSEPDPVLPIVPKVTPITKTYPTLLITELLIDPAKPLLDKDDEYVELFNPNSFMVDLKSYILQTGKSFNYTYTLPSYQLAPLEYLAIFSKDSALILANSGGAARLLDPNMDQVSSTDEYSTAKPDQVWSLVDGVWQWSNVASPNTSNVVAEDNIQVAVLQKRIVANTSQTTTSLGDDTLEINAYSDSLDLRTTNYRVLVSIVLATLIYAVYEYRHDISNFYAKSRGYIKSRRQNWPKFKWWRSS